jgi:hypothetical protein
MSVIRGLTIATAGALLLGANAYSSIEKPSRVTTAVDYTKVDYTKKVRPGNHVLEWQPWLPAKVWAAHAGRHISGCGTSSSGFIRVQSCPSPRVQCEDDCESDYNDNIVICQIEHPLSASARAVCYAQQAQIYATCLKGCASLPG